MRGRNTARAGFRRVHNAGRAHNACVTAGLGPVPVILLVMSPARYRLTYLWP